MALLGTTAILVASVFMASPAFASSKIAHDYQNANCQEKDYETDNGSSGLHVTSCIYLFNNSSWINAVVSWNNIPCDLYNPGKSSKSDQIDITVFKGKDVHAHDLSMKKTCGHSGYVSWQGPVANNQLYHTSAKVHASDSSDGDNSYYIIDSPSVRGFVRASRKTPRVLPSTPIKIHGFGNYQ